MSEPNEIAVLTNVERMLAKATTIDKIKHIRDTAEAARLYSRRLVSAMRSPFTRLSSRSVPNEKWARFCEPPTWQPVLRATSTPANQWSGRTMRPDQSD